MKQNMNEMFEECEHRGREVCDQEPWHTNDAMDILVTDTNGVNVPSKDTTAEVGYAATDVVVNNSSDGRVRDDGDIVVPSATTDDAGVTATTTATTTQDEWIFANNNEVPDMTSSTMMKEHKRFAFVGNSTKLDIRDQEEGQLLEAYERMFSNGNVDESRASTTSDSNRSTTEFVIISGPTGVGKTTLASSIRERVMSDGGIFCMGKFDSLQGNEPYAAFVSAFTEFTNTVVGRGEEAVSKMKQSILTAVGTEAKVLTDTIPALTTILGEQCERSHTLPTSDVSNQFKFLFAMFLQAVASPEQPLVLFLDDLHWADESSVVLLQSLVADVSTRAILFIGAIRNDAVPTGKLQDGLEQLRKSGVRVTPIQLQNLEENAVLHIMSQLFDEHDDHHILPLANIVHHQTGGNTFFILEMLECLQDDGLVFYDDSNSCWCWNEQDIRLTFQQTSISELVTDRIFQLPKNVQDLLKVASCLGSKLDAKLLSYISKSFTVVDTLLRTAAASGLLMPNGPSNGFAFSHDGIREATYNLIPSSERASFHLDIGRALKRLHADHLDSYIFVMLGQLERGSDHILDQQERNEVASLCVRAGALAVRSSSFKTASSCFLFGIKLLDANTSWREEYDMCLELHNCAAEVEYCNGHFESLDLLAERVISKARVFADTLRVRACQVYSLGGRNLMSEAIDKGLEVLKELGVTFPKNPGCFDLRRTLRRTRRSIRRFAPEDILTLPLMHDRSMLAAMQMMNLMFLYAFSSQSLLAPLMTCRMVDITLDHGLSAMASSCMSLYGALLIGFGKRIDEGFLYGELAFDLYHKFGEKAWLGRLAAAYYSFVSGWRQPCRDILAPLKEAHRVALATGDIEMAMLNANIYCWAAMEFESIPTLEREIQGFVRSMQRYGQQTTSFMIQPLQQLCQNLLGVGVSDVTKLTGNIMNQDDYFALARRVNPPSELWGNFHLAMLGYLFGDYHQAEHCISVCRDVVLYPFCAFSAVNIVLFDGLSALAQLRDNQMNRINRVRRLRVARRGIKSLSRWSDDAPINFLGKLFLLKAELAAVTGKTKAAVHNFTCAFGLLSKGGFIMLEAIAYERAARFFLERRDSTTALKHFEEAHALYVQWGGHAKAEQLRSEMDRLFRS